MGNTIYKIEDLEVRYKADSLAESLKAYGYIKANIESIKDLFLLAGVSPELCQILN